MSWLQRCLRSTQALLSGETGQKWLLTLADQAIVSGAGFLAGVIIGRACGKEQFGLYLLGLTIIGLIMELQYVFIWSPYVVYSPRLHGRAHALYTGSTFIHQIAVSALGILALAGSRVCLSWGIGPEGLDPVIWMLVIAGGFIALREYARRVCFAALQIKAALVMDSCATIIQVGGLVLLAYLGSLSASRALGVIGFGCGIAGISWLFRMRKALAVSVSQSFADLGQNWSFGKWILGSSLAIFMSSQLYPWFLTGFHGLEAVGVLAACQGVVGLANPFLYGSCMFLEPKAAHSFAQGGIESLRTFVVKSTALIGAVTLLFAAIFIAFGSPLLVFIYGVKYAGHGSVISILALYTLVSALDYGIYYGIWAVGRSDLNFKINLLRLAVTFTLGFWLVKRLGLLGVAWGFLVGSLAVFFAEYFVFLKLSRAPQIKAP